MWARWWVGLGSAMNKQRRLVNSGSMVEHLPVMCKALGINLRTTKKKKKEKKGGRGMYGSFYKSQLVSSLDEDSISASPSLGDPRLHLVCCSIILSTATSSRWQF
jgi:hypothetical protein